VPLPILSLQAKVQPCFGVKCRVNQHDEERQTGKRSSCTCLSHKMSRCEKQLADATTYL
jgi:hypothetical protein